MSKTVNDSNIDLNKFPASKVHQLAKKMESFKATAKHIKQVASDLQATQIHLMCHQHTELAPSKIQRKQKKSFMSRQATSKQHYHEDKQSERMPEVHRRFNNNLQAHIGQERYPSQRDTNQDRGNKCGNSQHVEGFRCPDIRYQCKNCHKFGHFSSLCYKKNGYKRSLQPRSPKAHQLKIGSVCMQDSLCGQFEDNSSDDSFCL